MIYLDFSSDFLIELHEFCVNNRLVFPDCACCLVLGLLCAQKVGLTGGFDKWFSQMVLTA